MAKYKVVIDGEEVEIEKPTVADELLKTANEAEVIAPPMSAVASATAAAHKAGNIGPEPVGVTAVKVANDLIDSGKVINPYTFMSENINKRNEDLSAKTEAIRNHKATFADNTYEVTPEDKAKIDSLYTPQPAIPEPRKQTARERYETRQFEYNLEDDPLWQQYISSARRNGQRAMDDTMAKVAAQTGGIAGSYAVSAGAGAYNDYMQEANEVIPYLEQLAYQKYQDELNRDLNLYEMEEAERWEEAERATALQKVNTDGAMNLTDREKTIINASGDSWIVGDTVYTPNGEVASDKVTENAILKGWQKKGRLTASEESYLRDRGYWIDDNGDLIGPDGTNYATEGGYITGLEAKYKSGIDLNSTEIQELEAAGYKYQNGMLYKNGTLIPREFMPYDEKQVALEDYNTNTWYGMSEENKDILKKYGYVFNAATGNLTDGTTEYAPYNGSTIENILWKYMAGNQLTYDEMEFIGTRNGYSWGEDGKLYLNGEEVKKIINEEEVKSLESGEIPYDLVQARNEIIAIRGTNKSLSSGSQKALAKYGFWLVNGQYIHQATGKSLDSFFGETPSVTNPGGGTQGGTNPSTYTGGKTRYTPTPTPKTTPAPTSKNPNPIKQVTQPFVDLVTSGDKERLKTTLAKVVDSGYMTEAEADALILQYVEIF